MKAIMSYEEFVTYVKENFKQYLPEAFKDAEVIFHQTKKVNRMADEISIKKNSDINIFPSINLSALYEIYTDTEDLDKAMEYGVEMVKYEPNDDLKSQAGMLTDFEAIKDRIIYTLVSTNQNKQMLCDVPRRDFLDMSVMYRIVLDNSENGLSSVIVTNGLMDMYKTTEEELFSLAKENTKNILPYTVETMSEMFQRMLKNMDVPEKILSAVISDLEKADVPPMIVISNNKNNYGSNAILETELLSKVANDYDSNLVILPSSLHEVIAIATNETDPEIIMDYADMVRDINQTEISLKDRLSNQVYLFDKDTKEISIASDIENNLDYDNDEYEY